VTLSGGATSHPGAALGARAAYAARASRAVLADPYAGCDRILERLAERRERRQPPFRYTVTSDWHAHLHAALGLPWPCAADAQIDEVWRATNDDLTARGLVTGRGTFGGWDDGGRSLVGAAYCLVRHLRPERVVETGVAHGVTTRFILEALARNGSGRLWSIDLPPLIDRHLETEVGVAVPERLRGRWKLIRGSSRQRLRPLLTALGTIDVFVHDSMHTTRNVQFELSQAWPALTPGGVVIADDIDFNRGFGTFAARGGIAHSLVARHDDTDRLFGILVKTADPARTPQ
jgi:predicted O-methyltransferase YrrM